MKDVHAIPDPSLFSICCFKNTPVYDETFQGEHKSESVEACPYLQSFYIR